MTRATSGQSHTVISRSRSRAVYDSLAVLWHACFPAGRSSGLSRSGSHCAVVLCYLVIVAILYDLCGARSFIWRGSAVHDGGGVLDWRQTNLVSCLSGAGTGSSVGHCIADAGVLVRNGAFIFDGNRA